MEKKDIVKFNMDFADNSARLLESYSGVKAVRPYRERAFRGDGNFVNVMTKYGTGRDSSEYYSYVADADVTDTELVTFYEQNGLFARIIDTPAEEAVKHGFEMKDLSDDGIKDFIDECLDELDWEETAMQSLKWARLFGGSIAVMMINDGRGVDEPLDWKHIESIDDIRIYDRSVVVPDYSSMYEYSNQNGQDPFRTRGSRLGYPEYFYVSSRTGQFKVHETRCLIFQNGVLPEGTATSQYQFWGMPEYVRINRAIRDVEIAHGLAPKMLDRSVQAIYKMKDLAMLLGTEQGEDAVLQRMKIIDMSKGLLNSMVLDADGEDYDFKSFSYTGVSDVINTTCNFLSALTNIPQTILFGRSPAGMNATGASDLENYYNYVERIQKRMLRSNLRYLLSVICQAGKHTGEIKRVPRIRIDFNSLWSMTEQEKVALELQKAQVSASKAQTTAALIQAQVIDPSEARREYAKDEEYDIDTMLDDYSEEELEENAPANKQQGGEDQMGGGDNPFAALMGGGDPGTPKGRETPGDKATEKEAPAQAKQKADAEGLRKKVKKPKGNSPDAAPEATKLPQDMDFSDEMNKDSEHAVSESTEPVDEKTERPPATFTIKASPYVTAKVNKNARVTQPRANAERNGAGRKAEPENSWDRLETIDDSERRPNGGVGVLLMQGNKILTGTRIAGDAGGYGLLCGPGGHIEDMESPEEAAYRETEEEFGVRPINLKLLGVVGDDDPDVQKSYIFVGTTYSGIPKCDDEEMREAVWRDLEELSNMEDRLFKPFRESLYLLLMNLYREDEKGEPAFATADSIMDE